VTRSARPISGDSEIFPGGGVGRRPVPRLLVPGPAAGVERLRDDREVSLTSSVDDSDRRMNRIGIQTVVMVFEYSVVERNIQIVLKRRAGGASPSSTHCNQTQ
jgi:hypothetical protein